MKTIKFFALAATMLCAATPFSYGIDFFYDGIAYDFVLPDSLSVAVSGDLPETTTSVVIPDTVENYLGIKYPVTEIGKSAFYNLPILQSVTLPKHCVKIGDYAFSECRALEKINLSGVLEIGKSAFYNCKSLKQVTLAEGVTSIARYTFMNCSGLTSVTLPNSLVEIQNGAFGYCTGLTSITIPENVRVVWGRAYGGDKGAFYGCSNLGRLEWNAKTFLRDNFSYWDRVWENGPFADVPITSVIIGSSADTLPTNMCKNMTKLKSITIPNTVKAISISMFAGCTSLEYVSIPSSVKGLLADPYNSTDYLFNGCVNGKCCRIDANLQPYEENSTLNYCKFDSLVFGSSVTSFDVQFVGAYQGTDIYFESVAPPTILNADKKMSNIIYVHVPRGTKEAYRAALGDNYIYLEPNESRTITGSCGENLTYTIDPTTGDCVISGTGDMTDYSYNNYSPFYRYRTLFKNITLQEGITSIGECAFGGCTYEHEQIILPESLQKIGTGALCFEKYVNGPKYYDYGENVREVRLGKNITYLGENAFNELLTVITCCSTTPPTISKNYPPAPNLLLVRVPKGTTEAYRTAWGDKYIYAEEGMSDTTGVLLDDVNWSFNPYTRILSITGNGPIPNFKTGAANLKKPWAEFEAVVDSVYIGDSITYIGNYAFSDCTPLKSLVIPSGVKAVGYSLATNSDIRTLYINASLTSSQTYISSGVISSSIGEWIVGQSTTLFPFNGTKLTNVYIADSVTSVAPYMFAGCDSLRSIVIPNSVKTIGRNAFEACSNLASIQLPNALEVIDTACFYRTTALESITLPKTIKRIGQEAFVYSAITQIDLPEGLEAIEEAAFGSSALTSIKLPNSLQELGKKALFDTQIDTLVVPENVKLIGPYIVSNDFYCYGASRATLKLLVWNAKNATNTSVEHETWGDSSSPIFWTDKIVIGENVESLPHDLAVYDYPSVRIPDKVQTICPSALMYFTGIPDTIYIGTGLKKCGKSAMLCWRSSPRHIFIKDIAAFCQIEHTGSFTSRSSHLYLNGIDVNEIGTIIIPDSVEYIRPYTFSYFDFSGCDIIFGKNVLEAQQYAFAYSYIRSLTTNDNLLALGTYTWNSSSSRYEIIGCFGNSSNYYDDARIGTLTLGKNIQTLNIYGPIINHLRWNVYYDESRILKYPSLLYSVEFGDSILNVPAYLCRNTNLSSIYLPNTIQFIGDQAFYGCYNLADINMPQSLTTVGKEAFSGCGGISELSFAQRCQLKDKAFYNCTGLKQIYCYSDVPGTCASDAFDGLDKFGCTLYVPAGSEDKYKVATGWRDFFYTKSIGADSVETGAVSVVPEMNDALFTWPTTDNANTYSLQINKDSVIFCTLQFNANGQLLGIAFAPSEKSDNNNSESPSSGFQFRVTGLQSATRYSYSIDVMDDADNLLKKYTGKFKTKETPWDSEGEFEPDPDQTPDPDTEEPDVTLYAITIVASENGVILSDKATATTDEIVTLTIVPNDGYKLGELQVKMGDNDIAVTDDFKFTMPAGAVTISGIFEEESTALKTTEAQELRTESGRIICDGEFQIFDLLGRNVTRLNGQLNGVYIVKVGDKAQKVLVSRK